MSSGKLSNIVRYSATAGLMFLVGCDRAGSLPWGILGNDFLDPTKLGIHNESEKNGQVYTLDAGPIDIAHARFAADRTKIAQEIFYERLLENEKGISFKIDQPATYLVQLGYPDSWNTLPEERKENIAKETSIELGAYFAYVDLLWHEVLTSCGERSMFLICEKPSAFSCEDNISNALGAYVGKVALRDKENSFNQAVTIALDNELERLCAQPRQITVKNASKTKGKKHFDIGLNDGLITPWYVPNTSPGRRIKDYIAPTFAIPLKYNFSIDWNLKPNSAPGNKALKYIGKTSEGEINSKELCDIVDYIKEKNIKEHGSDILNP